MELHERIKVRRNELGMSQYELAKKMGYTSRSTIAKIESGENDITQSKIEAFAKALETTPAWLMGWTEEQKKLPVVSNEKLKEIEEVVALYEKATPEQKAAVTALLKSLGLD